MARLWHLLRETGSSLLPIVALLLLFQVVILRRPLERWRDIAIGLLLALVGLMALVYGLRYGIGPLGDAVSGNLSRAGSPMLVLVFGFLLGLCVTYSEPALLVMADRVHELSGGDLSRRLFITTVAVGVALGTTVGLTRIQAGIEATSYFIPVLASLLVLTYFAPERYTALAFDAALATTGPLTVTLVVALGTGLATALGRSDTLLYAFGLVTLAALGPIVAVLLLGIILGLRGG